MPANRCKNSCVIKKLTQYLTEMPICIELYIGTCPEFFPITGLYPTLTPIS